MYVVQNKSGTNIHAVRISLVAPPIGSSWNTTTTTTINKDPDTEGYIYPYRPQISGSASVDMHESVTFSVPWRQKIAAGAFSARNSSTREGKEATRELR